MSNSFDDIFFTSLAVLTAPVWIPVSLAKDAVSYFKSKSANSKNENKSANKNNKNDNNNNNVPVDNETELNVFGMIRNTKIQDIKLIYPTAIYQQMQSISKILSKDNFNEFQKRMIEKKFGRGYIALFHGVPGTGKTESVMQIAKNCGRDIYKIDIAEIESKYISETGLNVRNAFKNYKKCCNQAIKNNKPIPILLFNEADALIGKRHSLESLNPVCVQDNNRTQNILLEEFENFEGILFMTTNIVCNLDKAFERRIFDKVEFKIPDIKTRMKIWQINLPTLTKQEISVLANDFKFSGGDINLVMRNTVKLEIVKGRVPNYKEIYQICRRIKIDAQNEV